MEISKLLYVIFYTQCTYVYKTCKRYAAEL
jgi:hypothetical protein